MDTISKLYGSSLDSSLEAEPLLGILQHFQKSRGANCDKSSSCQQSPQINSQKWILEPAHLETHSPENISGVRMTPQFKSQSQPVHKKSQFCSASMVSSSSFVSPAEFERKIKILQKKLEQNTQEIEYLNKQVGIRERQVIEFVDKEIANKSTIAKLEKTVSCLQLEKEDLLQKINVLNKRTEGLRQEVQKQIQSNCLTRKKLRELEEECQTMRARIKKLNEPEKETTPLANYKQSDYSQKCSTPFTPRETLKYKVYTQKDFSSKLLTAEVERLKAQAEADKEKIDFLKNQLKQLIIKKQVESKIHDKTYKFIVAMRKAMEDIGITVLTQQQEIGEMKSIWKAFKKLVRLSVEDSELISRVRGLLVSPSQDSKSVIETVRLLLLPQQRLLPNST